MARLPLDSSRLLFSDNGSKSWVKTNSSIGEESWSFIVGTAWAKESSEEERPDTLISLPKKLIQKYELHKNESSRNQQQLHV
jgi:hypothetical protein